MVHNEEIRQNFESLEEASNDKAPAFEVKSAALVMPKKAGGETEKLALATVEYDPYKWWDATNKRWIPRVSGVYMVTVFYVSVTKPLTANAFVDVQAVKNGSNTNRAARFFAPGVAGGVQGSATYLFTMNGTTDYVECYGNQTGTEEQKGDVELYGCWVGP